MTDTTRQNLGRLRWRCRRGMKELDVLLVRWLERMLRIYLMQQWFNLSDPGMEDALYDSEAMRRFSGIELWPVNTNGYTARHGNHSCTVQSH